MTPGPPTPRDEPDAATAPGGTGRGFRGSECEWSEYGHGENGTSTKEQPVAVEAFPLEPTTEETGFVRPYALTGGRTKANYHLELETLVSTRTAALLAVPDQIELQVIMEECRTPQSVAEIASRLRVPLGVARVLISDAADAGLVTVHRTVSGDEGAEAHLKLMERVLSGLRRL
ncbi:Protein of unknown function (DUF742) [Saccharomonospora glauca K62]|jgi:hypothetical protein|uniref:DUF742 domain-containing protein n=1 Tax=Saccharomonospora glauca K62 TaxID=928724 RepID=I1D3X9_9PSEU|nr:Protein of unknown function (DUF742) [Saccharomonospora glauca K62]